MENDIHYKSRTQVKKDVEELQKLGEELSKLPSQQLKRMALPDDLRKALIEAQSIKSNIAGRRQRQFIGALMRNVDPEPIRQALLETHTGLPPEPENNNETRMWIDRLLTDDLAQMETLLCEFPGLERQRLRQLVRNIKKEKPGAKTFKSRRALQQLIMAEMSHCK